MAKPFSDLRDRLYVDSDGDAREIAARERLNAELAKVNKRPVVSTCDYCTYVPEKKVRFSGICPYHLDQYYPPPKRVPQTRKPRPRS